jgi:hypothetical protein
MTRWPKTLLTIAGTLLGVCVLVATVSATRDEPTRPTEPGQRPGRVVNETPVVADLATRVPAPPGWRLLDAPADYVAYSGWLVTADPELAARVRTLASDDTYVHLAGHQNIGCGPVSGPLLRRAYNTYTLDFASVPTEPGLCYAPFDAVVVFRIPRTDARAVFGTDPVPAGPGRLAAHFALTGTRPSSVRATEITHRGDRDGLLATLAADGDRQDPARLAVDIEAALGPRPDDVRVFAFPVASCIGATPVLDIAEAALRVRIPPTCAVPVPSVVVFVVPTRVIPADVTLG